MFRQGLSGRICRVAKTAKWLGTLSGPVLCTRNDRFNLPAGNSSVVPVGVSLLEGPHLQSLDGEVLLRGKRLVPERVAGKGGAPAEIGIQPQPERPPRVRARAVRGAFTGMSSTFVSMH